MSHVEFAFLTRPVAGEIAPGIPMPTVDRPTCVSASATSERIASSVPFVASPRRRHATTQDLPTAAIDGDDLELRAADVDSDPHAPSTGRTLISFNRSLALIWASATRYVSITVLIRCPGVRICHSRRFWPPSTRIARSARAREPGSLRRRATPRVAKSRDGLNQIARTPAARAPAMSVAQASPIIIVSAALAPTVARGLDGRSQGPVLRRPLLRRSRLRPGADRIRRSAACRAARAPGCWTRCRCVPAASGRAAMPSHRTLPARIACSGSDTPRRRAARAIRLRGPRRRRRQHSNRRRKRS